ncbi:transcriptional regulatory [Fusarium sporotrichioides]|uniref:Transcriptional regulatory n=1 Tax=Fusarium sporotrichioides TaxID=5514 RepID=A0A395SF32_FUSSP|nr:transcriptional regulatory [Fusarium sporotrichioides]
MTSNDTAVMLKKTKSSAPRRRTGCQTCRYSIPFKVPGSQRDRQLLHYFCVQGASEISGFLTSDFWSDIVLRESHQDSTLRQALVAMSSIHLDYITSDEVKGQAASVETLDNYGKAIRTVRKRLAQPSPATTKVALICCIIFYCSESTLGNLDTAQQHLSNGLELLKSISRHSTEMGGDEMRALKTIFERLDMQASFFQDDRVPILSLPDWEKHKADYDALVPETCFSTLQEAHESLVKLQSWLYSFVNRNVDTHEAGIDLLSSVVLEEKAALATAYSSWSYAFDNFQLTKKHDDHTMYGRRFLLVHFRICQMILDSKFPVNEEVFGASPNPAAHQILDLAETLLDYTTKLNSSPSATQTPRRNFSLESGVVAPLFALALKCSDESVATRAAQMLSLSQRREGLYDAQTMATILTLLKRSRDGEKEVEDELENSEIATSALEYHIPSGYQGGGIDKLLASMSI